MPLTNDSTPKQRQLRSGSGASAITLNDIKVLIESACSDVVKTLTSKIDDLKQTISSLQLTVKELESNNTNLMAKCDSLETQLQYLKEEKDFTTATITSEVEDRMNRNFSLVISGIPESTSESVDRRSTDDRSSCVDVLSAVGLDEGEVEQIFRVGRAREGSDRLLKVKCKTVNFRNSVLRRAKELSKHSKFRHVFIKPDLTPLQQVHRKNLLDELRRRKNDGDNVVIFRDRIIPRSNRKFF